MKKYLIIVLTVSISNLLYGQLFTGGNMSFNFNNQGIYLDAAPEIGYRFMGKLSVGMSPFVSVTKYNSSPDIQYMYGGRLFSRLEILNGAYAVANVEAINIKTESGRAWNYALPIGAGFRYKYGKISVYSEVLYDILLKPDSPRENPIVRGGINYDF